MSNREKAGYLWLGALGVSLAIGLQAPAAWGQAATDLVCAGCVQGSDIANGTIGPNKLIPGSVNAATIANQSIGPNKLIPGSINAATIANQSIGSNKLIPGAINSAVIGNGAVTGNKIADGVVNTPKLADGAVTNAKIAPGTITADKLALAISPTESRTPVTACQTIDQPGSYLVTQNLTASGDCLIVEADFVTLDLGGFALSGSGTGAGVTDNENFVQGLALRNGTIENFSSGVNLNASGDCIIDGLRVLNSAFTGILSGSGCRVTNNILADNGGSNIQAGSANLVSRNVVDGAGGGGIRVGRGSIVSENIVSNSGGDGVVVGQGTLVTSNAISGSAGRGIDSSETVSFDAALTNNVVTANDVGINYKFTVDGLLVANNVFRGNTTANQQGGTCGTCTVVHNAP